MDLLERVRATGLLPEGGELLVLLSGGRDSVCLLDLGAEPVLEYRSTVDRIRPGCHDDLTSCHLVGRIRLHGVLAPRAGFQ